MEEKALRKRQDIPDAYKWKLTDMYATDELWEKDVDVVYALAEEIAAYKGTLGTSAQRLLSYFEKMDELDEHLTRVYVYANESGYCGCKISGICGQGGFCPGGSSIFHKFCRTGNPCNFGG